MGTEAMRFLVVWMAGWINSRQLEVDYLRAENRVLREQLAGRRLRFTDDQRRRLAVKGQIVGRRWLGEFACLVTPVLCQDKIGRNCLEGPGLAARHPGMKSAEPGASAR